MAFSSFCFFFALANVSGLAGLACPARYQLPWILSLFITSVLAFQRLGDIPISADLASTVGLFIIIWNAHVLSVVTSPHQPSWKDSRTNRSKREREDDKISTEPPSHSQDEWQWKCAYKMLYNSRWIGTSTEVPGTRAVHAEPIKSVKKGNQYCLATFRLARLERYFVSPRIGFLVKQIQRLLVIAAVTKFLSMTLVAPQHDIFQPLQIHDIDSGHDAYFRRVGEVTLRETAIRVVTVICFIWNAYSNLTALHAALSITFVVLLRLDSPKEWPPLFGDVRKAVSIRRFWTGFWHSLAYRPYAAIARLLMDSLLGLKKQNPMYLPVRNFTIFMCSGVSHALVAQQLLPCGAEEEVWWFAVNFAMIVLESIFALIAKKAGLRPSSPVGRSIWRLGGYGWTLGFMFWSLPKVQFRQLRCVVNDDT